MKKIMLCLCFVLIVSICFAEYPINAIQNLTLGMTPVYLIGNDTEMKNAKKDMADTDIFTVGYFDDTEGFLIWSNSQVDTSGENNFKVVLRAMNAISIVKITKENVSNILTFYYYNANNFNVTEINRIDFGSKSYIKYYYLQVKE